MLKFQDDYITLIVSLEDFILLVSNISKMSDFEIILWSICGELIRMVSENTWYSFVKHNYHHLLSVLCYCTRFNRTRRTLLQVTELF